MSKTVITPEIANFIKANYLKISMTTIANKVGISRCAVTNYMQKNNLKVPKEILIKFRSIASQKPFSSKENKFIIDKIKDLSIKEIAASLKTSYTTIQKQAHLLGLTAIIEEKKQASRFHKGHVSFNKGKKQSDYMKPEAIERTKKTRFQKGLTPPNTLPVGAEVLRKISEREYWLIKNKNSKNLIFKHIYLWETANGKLPKGYNVVFKDGNTLNCVIENLECISDAELMERNSFRNNYPPEIQQLIQLKGVLNRQINKHQKS